MEKSGRNQEKNNFILCVSCDRNKMCPILVLGERLVGGIHLLEEPQPYHGQQ